MTEATHHYPYRRGSERLPLTSPSARGQGLNTNTQARLRSGLRYSATANMLAALGFDVTGIDPSVSGIALAKAA